MSKHLPGAAFTVDNLGMALHLEKEYWDNMEVAIANGISKALKG